MEHLYVMVNIRIVVNIVSMVVRMDRQGRIVIPVNIRKNIKSNIFLLEVVNDEIHLKPIKTTQLTSLVDKIEVDVDDFTDTHKLRKALVK